MLGIISGNSTYFLGRSFTNEYQLVLIREGDVRVRGAEPRTLKPSGYFLADSFGEVIIHDTKEMNKMVRLVHRLNARA